MHDKKILYFQSIVPVHDVKENGFQVLNITREQALQDLNQMKSWNYCYALASQIQDDLDMSNSRLRLAIQDKVNDLPHLQNLYKAKLTAETAESEAQKLISDSEVQSVLKIYQKVVGENFLTNLDKNAFYVGVLHKLEFAAAEFHKQYRLSHLWNRDLRRTFRDIYNCLASEPGVVGEYLDHCFPQKLTPGIAFAWASLSKTKLRIWQSSKSDPDVLEHTGLSTNLVEDNNSLHLIFLDSNPYILKLISVTNANQNTKADVLSLGADVSVRESKVPVAIKIMASYKRNLLFSKNSKASHIAENVNTLSPTHNS